MEKKPTTHGYQDTNTKYYHHKTTGATEAQKTQEQT